MSLVVKIISPDLKAQIEKLERADQIFEKNFRRAIEGAVAMTFHAIEGNIPHRTGKAAGSFRREVSGFGKNLMGQVGWWGEDVDAWYINIVDAGARSHSLKAKSKQRTQKDRARFEKKLSSGRLASARVFINGQWVTMAVHPGFSKRGFMAAGFSAMQPLVMREMQDAAARALAEQGIK